MAPPELSDAIVSFFSKIPVFERINADEIKLIAKHMNVVHLVPQEVLFKEQDKGNFMCFIAEGAVDEIKSPDAAAQDVTLTTLYSGQSLGEMSVIENRPRSATIRARERAVLYILSQAAFDMILRRYPHVGIKLLKGVACLLSDNLRKTSSRLADYMLPIN